MDWVLIIPGTQVIKKKRPARPVFPDYLSVSYDYDSTDSALDEIVSSFLYEFLSVFTRFSISVGFFSLIK